jgi:hypothetical protein
LVRVMPKFSRDIPPLLTNLILLRLLGNVLEQLDAHPKMPKNVALGVGWIVHKIDPHHLL